MGVSFGFEKTESASDVLYSVIDDFVRIVSPKSDIGGKFVAEDLAPRLDVFTYLGYMGTLNLGNGRLLNFENTMKSIAVGTVSSRSKGPSSFVGRPLCS